VKNNGQVFAWTFMVGNIAKTSSKKVNGGFEEHHWMCRGL
jgi:hypothetical protein